MMTEVERRNVGMNMERGNTNRERECRLSVGIQMGLWKAEHRSKGVQPENRMPTKDGMWIGDKIYMPYNTSILTRNHIFILLDGRLQPTAQHIKENRATR